MDVHPVILAGGRGSRMYPLTEECPKALLPVCNVPLIYYPIHLLEKHGFKEALVVVRDSQHRDVSECLDRLRNHYGVGLNLSLCDIPEQEEWGTADSLRHIRSKVKGDVLLMSCDLVTSANLQDLILFHHAHHSALTTLLLDPPPPQDTPTLAKKSSKATPTEQDLIGLTRGTSQIVLFTSQADLEEELQLHTALLVKHPHIQIFSQLMDAHVYISRRWILDYLLDNKSLSSVKGELVPHLVRCQSRGPSSSTSKAMAAAANNYMDEMACKAYAMSSTSSNDKQTRSDFSCYAQVVRDVLCVRVNTLAAYSEANRLVAHSLQEFGIQRPAGSIRHKSVGGDSVVSKDGVVLGDKASIKHSCVGDHCHIGEKTKIVNCIIMDHVHIGVGCVLHSSVLSSHARLEDHVTLKDCQVGARFTVTKEADLRGEALVVGGGMHF